MEGTKEIPLVTQGIDIWSLGCVFSVAATYVVAGKEGVKQYRLLRQRAISKLGQGYGDAFHDTRKVLPEVTQWHKYLRTSTRAQDTFTSKVLNIVDEFMLIVPGEARISGSKLSSTLKKINEDAQSQNQDQQQPPDDILNFLDEVMRLTVPERATSLALEEIPRTISQSGASMFEEALLYRSMRSEGRIPMRKLVAPETVETQLASNLAEQQPFVTSHHPSSQHIGLGYSNLPEYTTSLPQSPNEPMSFDDPPVTFWEVEAQLIQHGTKRSIPGIKMLNKRVSVHGKTLDGKNDQLMVHFKNRDLVSIVPHTMLRCSFDTKSPKILTCVFRYIWSTMPRQCSISGNMLPTYSEYLCGDPWATMTTAWNSFSQKETLVLDSNRRQRRSKLKIWTISPRKWMKQYRNLKQEPRPT